MDSFIISKKADEDIEEIFTEGLSRFGKKQAIKYLEELQSLFIFLSNNPDTGKNRDEIKRNLISFPYKSHIIFYRHFKTHIRIIRVLYGARDIGRLL